MNKNLLLALLAGGALVVVGALVLFSPSNKTALIDSMVTKKEKQASSNDIQIKVSQSQTANKQATATTKKKTKPKKERDPSVKYIGMDHYRNYIIELIDKNPEDKNIQLQSNNYFIVEGKINGKQFVIHVPKQIAYSPNLQLKITDIKTKETKTIPADFIQDIASKDSRTNIIVNIDFNNPENTSIQSNLLYEGDVAPLPSLN